MEFIADLHLHSHFSRATAKNLCLEMLYVWAQKKGVTLVGTGDFTHPGWFRELEEKLEPAAPGLYKLKKQFAAPLDEQVPAGCRNKVRFILQCEISSIYKREERVRKNHNLIYFPDLEKVKIFNARLDRIGNITSDGRPILGLDAETLLEIALEVSEESFLIPAHIWTPWFSMLGSKSGFDSIEECFGDLSSHIFAVETGLSSDPPMNRQVEDLDRVQLISSSDAHSPMYLGRNASVFTTGLSYYHVKAALAGGDPAKYRGTIDMFPQEGKYHHDGHRKCGISFDPAQTIAHDGICPVCKGPLTLGVLYRVQELASRPHGHLPPRHGHQRIIPLTDILSEIFDVGPKTKKVNTFYERALNTLGPELDILLKRSLTDIDAAGIPLLAPAIKKMRTGDVKIAPGFDGEYGKVSLFTPSEKRILKGGQELFSSRPSKKRKSPKKKEPRAAPGKKPAAVSETSRPLLRPASDGNQPGHKDKKNAPSSPESLITELNPAQKKALLCHGRPLLMAAGPGTGKTRTLTAKIAWLITEKKISPQNVLALTFTNRAAREMKERIQRLVPPAAGEVCACTFHAFCLMVLKEYTEFSSGLLDETLRRTLLKEETQRFKDQGASVSSSVVDTLISRAKQQGRHPGDPLSFIAEKPLEQKVIRIWKAYQERLVSLDMVDFEDLINRVLVLLTTDSKVHAAVRERFQHLFVDEYQDVNKGQYLLTRQLAGTGSHLCVIGDPDQSIYGFRGSDNRYFQQFLSDYPQAVKITLEQNYRSTETILAASHQMLSNAASPGNGTRLFSNINGRKTVVMLEAASERAEAVAVGKAIEQLTGGLSFLSMDSHTVDAGRKEAFSFADFAVLYRTRKQGAVFAEAFQKAGIPCQTADRENTLLLPGIIQVISLLKISCKKGTFMDLEPLLDHLKAGTGKKSRAHLRQWFQTIDRPLAPALEQLSESPPSRLRRDIRDKVCRAVKEILTVCETATALTSKEALQFFSGQWDLDAMIGLDKKRVDAFAGLLVEADAIPARPDFLYRLCLTTDADALAPAGEKVSLMTMHAAKGLEFPVVFITGCEDGLIPFLPPGGKENSASPPHDTDEERRLFYVAMTRARDILYFSHAARRMRYGKTIKTSKSPFLYDIEEKLTATRRNRYKQKPPEKTNKQLELF